MSKLRIGVDGSALLIAHKNGYENYATALITAMAGLPAAETEDMDIFLYFYAGNRLADASLLGEMRTALRRFTLRVYAPRRGFGVAFPVMALADRLDLLHLPVHVWARRFACPVVTTLHDACARRLMQAGLSLPSLTDLDQMLAQQVAMSRAFIAVSESTRQDVARLYGAPPERISVVYHGAETRFARDEEGARQVRRRYQLGRYILCVNGLQLNKNHGRLLQAYARLRGEHGVSQALVLVGRDGWGADQIRAEIEALGADSGVRLLGYVPAGDLPALYSGADLVVNPSLCEGFGLPILEALACGATMAAANATALPEIGGPAVAYFDPYDVEDMTAVMLRALTDEGVRSRLRAAATDQVSRFTWQQAAQQTLAVYRATAAGLRAQASRPVVAPGAEMKGS